MVQKVGAGHNRHLPATSFRVPGSGTATLRHQTTLAAHVTRGMGWAFGRPIFFVTPGSYGDLDEGGHMKISCDECVMQHSTVCKDCVVTYLLRESAGPVNLDVEEAEALGQMASVGLLPPLRLVRREATG